jgi:hypothetical protein
MATDHLDKVETDEGAFIVLTTIRYLGFLKMPRSSVMPFKTAQFLRTPGFRIRYRTSDPHVLHEWHQMIVALVRQGLFQAMADGARVGWFPYPDDKKHLRQFVKPFTAPGGVLSAGVPVGRLWLGLPHSATRSRFPETWVLARSLEWFAFPAFLSQSALPVCLAIFPDWLPVVLLLVLDFSWRFFCHTFVSVTIAEIGYLFWRFRWLFALLSAFFLFYHGHAIYAIIALGWPMISTWSSVVTNVLAWKVGSPATLVKVQARFSKAVGLDLNEDATPG